MRHYITFVGALVVLGMLTPGCTFLAYLHGSDPNNNDKLRYVKAHNHAQKVLRESGSELSPYPPDYDLMTFWRRHYVEETLTIHDCQLYDFLKTSEKPGPDRFVIAYDKATRKTYLRADLRSNENIETLPPVGSSSERD